MPIFRHARWYSFRADAVISAAADISSPFLRHIDAMSFIIAVIYATCHAFLHYFRRYATL